jgi:hypothetical protein
MTDDYYLFLQKNTETAITHTEMLRTGTRNLKKNRKIGNSTPTMDEQK